MLHTREVLEKIEAQTLAPFGFCSQDSRGRVNAEDEPLYRTSFQRDRDRILHTTAFRRLEYKTQVFVNHEGDYYRTRLTHTLEVAQVGRTLARTLGGNEDLVEAICLSHDLGHPPFGHAGESILNVLMHDFGGFEHNKQSLCVVEVLEDRYPDFHGLNLSWEIREGMVKHETDYDASDASRFEPEKRGSLAAQLANPADEVAYTAHDLDDGLRSGLIVPQDLDGLALWEQTKESVGWDGRGFDHMWRHRLVRRLLGMLVRDVAMETAWNLENAAVQSVADLRGQSTNMVGFSSEMHANLRALKKFLYENLYHHPRVVRMQIKAERILRDIFNAYIEEPRQLPREEQAKLEQRSLQRVVCDYIAGMTDRYALQEHCKMFDPLTRV